MAKSAKVDVSAVAKRACPIPHQKPFLDCFRALMVAGDSLAGMALLEFRESEQAFIEKAIVGAELFGAVLRLYSQRGQMGR